jgi:hypothetical protein
MNIQLKSSPFSKEAYVLEHDGMFLCNSEAEGGIVVEWYGADGALWMKELIAIEGIGEFQWLYEATCWDRLGKRPEPRW